MYKYRNAFVAPRTAVNPLESIEKLDGTALAAYASQLDVEKREWESNTMSFASLLKQPGNVIYHPSSVHSPGYCTPSLIVEGPRAAIALVGAAVGDGVKENAIRAYPLKPEQKRYPSDFDDSSYEDFCEKMAQQARRERRAKCGVITSISCDSYTEVSVEWDNGYNESRIWCGKKGSFALIYE